MKIKILLMSLLFLVPVFFLASGPMNKPARPADFRDAPRDIPSLTELKSQNTKEEAGVPDAPKGSVLPTGGNKSPYASVPLPQGSVPGLSRSGDLPLPSLGPDAEGAFRTAVIYAEGGSFQPAQAGHSGAAGELRVMQWNASRGEKLDKLMQVIKKADPDVLILSETDLYGKIAKGKVMAREIASALGYSYYTATEFGELLNKRLGSSGNAIVSRYPLSGGKFVPLPTMKGAGGYDWADNKSQPRTGQRNAISAYIEVPGKSGKTMRINLVSLHTENKANADVRRKQFELSVKELTVPGEPAILAGDLNTLSPGEGSAFRKYLKKESFIDCSKGDDQGTHMFNMRLDWVILQPGTDNSLLSKSYKVIDKEGASDHAPIITEFEIE